MKNKIKKVIVFELDGGSWDILDNLLDRNLLPTIKAIKEKGASLRLKSDYWETPVIWTSIYTGKPKEVTGADFFGVTAQNLKSYRIWEILRKYKKTAGIVGSMLTWPPQVEFYDKEFVIPSIMAPGPETIPERYHYLQELVLGEKVGTLSRWYYFILGFRLLRLGIPLNLLLKSTKLFIETKLYGKRNKRQLWKLAFLHADLTFSVFLDLFRRMKPDFSAFHYHALDTVSHFYYDDYERFLKNDLDTLSEVIPNAYKKADKMISKLLKYCDEDTAFIVISDHGFKKVEVINTYSLKFHTFKNLLGLGNDVVPAKLGAYQFKFSDQSLLERSYSIISRSKIKENNKPVFKVYRKENFIGMSIVHYPDLLNYTIVMPGVGEIPATELFYKDFMVQNATHDNKNAIFIAYGTPFKDNLWAGDYSIFDVFPTLLYMLGLPVPKDTPGKIIKEIFRDEFVKKRPVEYIDSYEALYPHDRESMEIDTEKITKRLQDLGYL